MAGFISYSGNARGYDITSFGMLNNPQGRQRGKKQGSRLKGAHPAAQTRERLFDMEMLGFSMQMLYQVPGAQFARRAMQARQFCGEFIVEFENWPGANGNESRAFGEESQEVVRRHWMPFLEELYDYKEAWGFCPYVWERIDGTNHYYPRVPAWGTYMLSYEEDRDGRQFYLYWIDGVRPERAEDVFWVRTSQEPQQGRLRTALSALLPEYELYLVLISCTKDAAINRANPYHIVERHPKIQGDLAEVHDTRVMFGQSAAMRQLEDVEGTRNAQEGYRKAYLMQALQHTFDMNYGTGWPGQEHMSADQADLRDTHQKFIQRLVHLDTDAFYRPAQQSDIVMKMEEIWRKLNQDAANALGFPLEFAQAQSAQRAANVAGNTRYINENVKRAIRDYTTIVERMWLVSPYGRIVHRLNELKLRAADEAMQERVAKEEKRRARKEKEEEVRPGYTQKVRVKVVKPVLVDSQTKRKRGKQSGKSDKRGKSDAEAEFRVPRIRSIKEPSMRLEHELRQLIKVKIKFSCVPEMQYDQLRELVLDKVISHGDFVKLAGDIFGMPTDMLSQDTKGKLMEQEQMEISVKDAKQKWRHQDQTLKWHEQRMELMKRAGAEGGGGGVEAPPPAPGSQVQPPSRAANPQNRRASSGASAPTKVN